MSDTEKQLKDMYTRASDALGMQANNNDTALAMYVRVVAAINKGLSKKADLNTKQLDEIANTLSIDEYTEMSSSSAFAGSDLEEAEKELKQMYIRIAIPFLNSEGVSFPNKKIPTSPDEISEPVLVQVEHILAALNREGPGQPGDGRHLVQICRRLGITDEQLEMSSSSAYVAEDKPKTASPAPALM